ncbi:MAG: MotA/TolQ/ExbB proton channel family protein, partial [Bdellovibrio sp.]
MLTSQIFSLAHYADQVVLWILILLSVVSVGIILERFFALRRISAESRQLRLRVKAALQSHSLEDIE